MAPTRSAANSDDKWQAIAKPIEEGALPEIKMKWPREGILHQGTIRKMEVEASKQRLIAADREIPAPHLKNKHLLIGGDAGPARVRLRSRALEKPDTSNSNPSGGTHGTIR
jgi:hypothetical protein